jgi:hypothetical protein
VRAKNAIGTLGVLSSALLAVACGAPSSTQTTVSQRTGSSIVTDAPPGVDVNRSLVALYDNIAGTSKERSASQYVSDQGLSEALASCMSSEFDLVYPIEPFVDDWANYYSDGEPTIQTGSRPSRTRLRAERRGVPQVRT